MEMKSASSSLDRDNSGIISSHLEAYDLVAYAFTGSLPLLLSQLYPLDVSLHLPNMLLAPFSLSQGLLLKEH
jgi:hypothetical protein